MAFLSEIEKFFPATVLVAISIFFTKEVFEFSRRRKERHRKISAIKNLMTEEIEKNYWAFSSLFRAFSSVAMDFESLPDARHRIVILHDGTEHLRTKRFPEDNFESGMWIPHFHDEQYKKLILLMAELDANLFVSVSSAYSDIAELSHYRSTLISFILKEDSSRPDEAMISFFRILFDRKEGYYKSMNAAYFEVSGKKLESGRLR
ncbi:MAG: hypothetical protein J0M21_12665 [Xanthomonadales bacterium]|nr:hypothetical protein [Xanthomonadales bacterium]